jgi:hypothetical protein
MLLRHTGEGEVQHHLSFTSALDKGPCPTSLPGYFTPRKELCYQLKRRLGHPHNWYGELWRTESLLLLLGLKRQKSNQLLVAILTTLLQNETKMSK